MFFSFEFLNLCQKLVLARQENMFAQMELIFYLVINFSYRAGFAVVYIVLALEALLGLKH